MTTTDQAQRRQDLYPTRETAAGTPTPRRHPTVWGGAADGPFSTEELEAHAQRGFTILEDFVSPTEVASLSDELSRLARDETLRSDERVVTEARSGDVRSIFEAQRFSDVVDALTRDPRLLGRARQLLGSDVYLHQTRVNYMPGFKGAGFYWHSDFETWHAEDGMPTPRAVSCSIALTENYPFNGGLMIMPGSHRTFVPGVGSTPEENYRSSLKAQEVGVPTEAAVTKLARDYGIDQFTGPAGTALWFDSNIMHGSGNNITPFPRSNVFLVFNSVDNALGEPYGATKPRPTYIANRNTTPLA